MEEELDFNPPYEDYSAIMNTLHILFDKITEWAEDNKSMGFPYVAARFGKKHGSKIRLSAEDDIDFIRNFHVAERINGISEAEKFYDSEEELTELEVDVLEAIFDSFYGYFQVTKKADIGYTEVELSDMLSKKVYRCHNFNLCSVSSEGDLFFGRLVPFRDSHIVGGASVLYGKSDLKLLKSKFSLLKIKKPRLDAFDLCNIGQQYRFQSEFASFYKRKENKLDFWI